MIYVTASGRAAAVCDKPLSVLRGEWALLRFYAGVQSSPLRSLIGKLNDARYAAPPRPKR